MSGAFAEYVWWPWTFWCSGLLSAIIAVIGSFTIPKSSPSPVDMSKCPGKTEWVKTIWALDLPAGLLGIASLILINFSWNQATFESWSEPYVPACLVCGLLLIPAFFYLEVHISPYPLIPFSALNTDVAFVLGCLTCAWAAFGIFSFYLWNNFLILRKASPLLGAAWTIPIIPAGLIAAMVVGWLIGSGGHPAFFMIAAEICVLIACLLLTTSSPAQTYWAQLFPALIFAPTGLDMSFPAATIILSNAVGKDKQGVAMSLVSTIVNYSMSTSLGIAGIVEQQVVAHSTGENAEKTNHLGFLGAEYLAVGFASLGLILSLIFLAKSRRFIGKER